jgi:hypothetical protein
MNDNYAPKTMAVPKQTSVGEKIENIEKQQVEILAMANEIKGKLIGIPKDENSSNPCGSDYISRLEEIVERNEEVRNVLRKILVIL